MGAVVELRQYTLHPGQRDLLIELFERELVAPQEAAGMRIVGQFRDIDRPDRFVWLRRFPDMRARREALQAFYGGSVWRAHRAAANATMRDSSDVLLLRPISDFPDPAPRSGTLVATVHPPDPSLLPALGSALALFETEPADNDFPALPVRPDRVVVAFFASEAPPGLPAPLQRLRLRPTAGSRLR